MIQNLGAFPYAEDYKKLDGTGVGCTKEGLRRSEQSASCADTAKVFGAGRSTAQSWVQKYEETGDLSDKALKRKPGKIDPDALRAYLREHPDDTQQEMADAFHCSKQQGSEASEHYAQKKRAAIKSGTKSE